MANITQSTWAKALWPGVNAWYGMAYNEYKPEWPEIFSTHTSKRAFEEDVGTSGFGLASIIGEGSGVTFDTQSQGFTTRYSHVRYGLGFVVTKIAFDDDLYGVVGQKRAKALAMSMRSTKETVGANILNRAFNASFLGGDAIQLVSTAHVNVAGGTWSNRLTTDATLSEAAIEQMIVDMGNATNDRGLQISIKPQKLVIPVELTFEAQRILKSEYRVGTAENDINALVQMNMLPMGVRVCHYLTSTTAWFIKTDVPDGLKYWTREDDKFAMENDFDTDNAKFKATSRYSFGWSDPRNIWGTTGT
jgi:hypothetical protein